LVRALHGRQPWTDFELHDRPWGSSPEREEKGKGRGRGGRHGEGLLGAGARPMAAWFGPTAALCAVCVRKKTAGRKEKRREGKEKKKGRKKRKGRKWENFSNLEIS
jgi:hypothetical protein